VRSTLCRFSSAASGVFERQRHRASFVLEVGCWVESKVSTAQDADHTLLEKRRYSNRVGCFQWVLRVDARCCRKGFGTSKRWCGLRDSSTRLPRPLVGWPTKVYSGVGAGIVMESISLTTGSERNLFSSRIRKSATTIPLDID
jgi:hypothetical protein